MDDRTEIESNMSKAEQRNKDKLLMSFLQELIKLKPEHAAGVATILKVPMLTKEGEVMETDLILQGLCAEFDKLTTKRKKAMIKLVKQAGGK